MVADGQVPHRRIGQRVKRGAIRITEEDYQRFIESKKIEEIAS
jgi:hypothetical protein